MVLNAEARGGGGSCDVGSEMHAGIVGALALRRLSAWPGSGA